MAIFDDLTKGLKSPMWSITAPATTQVRDESGKPTDQLISIPEDGDTKSADPHSWMKEEDFSSHPDIAKKPLMSLPGLGMQIFLADLGGGKTVANFVDDDMVPPGEIWVNKSFSGKNVRDLLLRDIVYSFLVWRAGHARDTASKIADSIAKAMGLFSTEKE